MAWAVDTCVLIDVLVDDEKFGAASADTLEALLPEGLVIAPMTYIELAPAFRGSLELQDEFLDAVGVDHRAEWTKAHTIIAHREWNRYITLRRRRLAAKRPLADILIGSFALTYQGFVTRNVQEFDQLFPTLRLQDPMTPALD